MNRVFRSAAISGGFLARGWEGVFAAASMCFFSYGGFDAISAAAEEANNPTRYVAINDGSFGVKLQSN